MESAVRYVSIWMNAQHQVTHGCMLTHLQINLLACTTAHPMDE